MINIELEIRKLLFSKLSTIYSDSVYVVGQTLDYDSVDMSKVYVWTTTFNNNLDFYNREFGKYFIDIHILAENTLKLSLAEELLYEELDKQSIGNYNYMSEIINSIEFTEELNGKIYPTSVISVVFSGGVKTFYRYTDFISQYTLLTQDIVNRPSNYVLYSTEESVNIAKYSLLTSNSLDRIAKYGLLDQDLLNRYSNYTIYTENDSSYLSNYYIMASGVWGETNWNESVFIDE